MTGVQGVTRGWLPYAILLGFFWAPGPDVAAQLRLTAGTATRPAHGGVVGGSASVVSSVVSFVASEIATAVEAPAGAVTVDGRLTEEIWTRAPAVSAFTQKEPEEGAPPSERTEVRFLFGEDALYVGARMAARGGRVAIQAPLGRRDAGELAESILISLDTFLDRRTAYSFGVTAAGVRIDHFHRSDDEDDVDPGFNPVWEARVSIDDEGWSAEMWIPYSQLRYIPDAEPVWGLNIRRWIPTRNEEIYWVVVPRTEQAWASRFGELHGVAAADAPRRIELMPYLAGGSTVNGDRDADDPFDDGVNLEGRAGLDAKVGLGPNLTLDVTVTPDFGQVEADPAVVNLTDFEVFFTEQRPFFTEGSQLLLGPTVNYFYSRRIGAPPPRSARGDFVDAPSSATILGAAKLTGRLPSGTSIGVLAAVTDEEHAETFDVSSSLFEQVRVAPRTTWGVARVQQQFGDAGSTAAVMVTGVHRDLAEGSALAALLNRNAITGNAESLLRLGGGRYELSLSGGLSRIDGDRGAILRAQRASQRYLQRPDASHVSVDSTRTSMSGGKATLNARKISGDHWLWSVYWDLESPEVEFNDIGRLGNGDGVMNRNTLTYRETRPRGALRGYRLTVGDVVEWNMGGVRQGTSLTADASVTWNNFWTTALSSQLNLRSQDQRLTRGGPSMATPLGWSAELDVGSSSAARTQWGTELTAGRDELGGWRAGVEARVSAVPTPSLQFSLAPSYERQVDPRQYVRAVPGGAPDTYGTRYVFAFIDRTTVAMEARVNFTLKPDMSLDVYAQPFAASGRYADFGELRASGSRHLRSYGTDGTTIAVRPDGSREVQDGGETFRIDNLDFRVRSFRATAVLRWEWRPGSTLYLVWQQDRSGTEPLGTRVGPGDAFRSLSATGSHFFAVKASYWLGL